MPKTISPEHRMQRSRRLVEQLAKLWDVPMQEIDVSIMNVPNEVFDSFDMVQANLLDVPRVGTFCTRTVVSIPFMLPDGTPLTGSHKLVALYCSHHHEVRP